MENKTEDNREKTLLIISVVFFMFFLFIAYTVKNNEIIILDEMVRKWVYSIRNSFLSAFFVPVTYLGNWQTLMFLNIILIVIRKTRKNTGIPLALMSISSTILYKMVKNVIQRQRPDVTWHLINQGGFSFPSGHSMNCIVCYGMLIYLIRRNLKNRKAAGFITGVLSVLVFIIGISRLYVGVHFATDIIGGWSLGFSFLCVCIVIYERIKEKNEIRKNY